MLLGAACQESKCGTFLKRLGGGPAVGIFQMEPRTHDDLWTNFIRHREPFAGKLGRLMVGEPDTAEMIWNLRYVAAMALIHYYRVNDPLPAGRDLQAQAIYWKRFYNTPRGAGTEAEFLTNWRRFS